jgi:hypothetical protein
MKEQSQQNHEYQSLPPTLSDLETIISVGSSDERTQEEEGAETEDC